MPARRSLALLAFVLAALPASAVDLLDRAQVAQRRSDGVMVASLTPLASLPLMQVYVSGGGGGGGGNLVMGTSTDDCGTAGGVFFDLSGKVQCDADIKFVTDTLTITKVAAPTSVTVGTTTTAGTATAVHSATMSGGATTSNFVNVTGTLPTTLTAAANALNFQLTGAGSSAQEVRGLNLDLLAGFTGAEATTAGRFTNASLGTGSTTPNPANGAAVGQSAVWGYSSGASNIHRYGVVGLANNAGAANLAIGGYFASNSSAAANPGTIGVVGVATSTNSAGTNPYFGGLFAIGSMPTLSSGIAALAASNVGSTADIFRLYDNTTLKVATLDGGFTAHYNMTLTTSTMTRETDSQVRTTTHSFTWTNAQVAALAGTSGEIGVATLPAKTVVENAYVVITGAAAGPATVTVSCGRTAASYIDYIVASDAKAAANTVYGDAAAERGTNLTGYDLPSYTGTTLVNCQFVSTGANLSTVTGSTGRVILKTSLVP